MATAKSTLNPLERDYGAALEEYLSRGEEGALRRGCQLGQDALTQGSDIMDMVAIHNRAASAVFPDSGNLPQLREALKRSGNFFAEFISAFERLHCTLNESTAALRRLNEISEEEAMRIAHLLHDECGELLAAIHMRLDELVHGYPSQVELRVREVRQFLHQIERQLKQLSHELRPTVLDDFGLPPAIQVLARGTMRKTSLQISVAASATRRLPMRIETAIYRFVQEALDNVTRHAQARHVVIRVWNRSRCFCCSVLDDGIGFNPAELAPEGPKRGLGLMVTKERLKAVGGSVEIISAPQHGTEIRVSVPTEV